MTSRSKTFEQVCQSLKMIAWRLRESLDGDDRVTAVAMLDDIDALIAERKRLIARMERNHNKAVDDVRRRTVDRNLTICNYKELIGIKNKEIDDLRHNLLATATMLADQTLLIRELADALEQRIDCCSNGCENCSMPICMNLNNRRLVAKAREMCK